MNKHPMGAALAGIGLFLINGVVVPDAASASALPSAGADTSAQMTAPVSLGANAHLANINGQFGAISSEQIEAYQKLSPSIAAKFGASATSQALIPEGVAMSVRDTIMCAW